MKQLFGHFVLNRIYKYYERQTLFSAKTRSRTFLFNQLNIHRNFRSIITSSTPFLLFNGNFAATGCQLSGT